MQKRKKQTNERHRTLIDEEDVEFNPPSSPISTTVEDFPLTAPQPTQDCALDENEDFALDVEDDMPWKPRDFSELKSRIRQRQKQAQPTGSRRINFDCDGLTISEDYAPKGPTWKGNASETGKNVGAIKKGKCMKMDMRSNKEKKQAKERHRTLIDEEDVEEFPLTSSQPTQDCASDEDENFGLDVEDDMPWKPRDFSELRSRIQQRQK
ncbi:hypothetical protein KY290_010685 [Solanum tuberosum]|uniref:Uncharacterized protein n=1 Tax=Solanum tuberosum TaxID=4113 RepID=A0ABQ7W0H5_SOLTU|nr:hypothetical protein KY290_010685 [Solanum tuberosum]